MLKNFIKKLPLVSHLLRKFDHLENVIEIANRNIENLTRAFFAANPDCIIEDIKNYHLFKHIKRIRSFLTVKDVDGMKYVRVGRDYDGGYVMADHFPAGSIAYSFGISNDVSWDMDIAQRGIDVFMYDHTIRKLPENHPRFHFFKIGLSGKSGLKDMKTMEEFLMLNKHEKNDEIILKMDIEGWEWEFLNSVDENVLGKFSQIVLELHGLTDASNSDVMARALEKLNKNHQLVHIHANNCGRCSLFMDTLLPESLEVSYLRRQDHNFAESDRVFPTPLDRSCRPPYDDIFLGKWNR